MPTSPRPHNKKPSTYFVEDRANRDELTRLTVQERIVTSSMGGVLPEQAEPGAFQCVLDVACGPGGWLLELAKTYPSIPRLVGVDISPKMIEYARKRAQAEQLNERVEFHVMDALRGLDFPNGYFDLVNQRQALSFLRTWDWPQLLACFLRITCPGGVVRFTESDAAPSEATPALVRFFELLVEAFSQSGHLFSPHRDSVSNELPKLLERYGVQNVQLRDYANGYRSDLPEAQPGLEDIRLSLRTMSPFIRKWAKLPDDFDEICQQAQAETLQPDFIMTWRLRTVWGIVPVPVSSPKQAQ